MRTSAGDPNCFMVQKNTPDKIKNCANPDSYDGTTYTCHNFGPGKYGQKNVISGASTSEGTQTSEGTSTSEGTQTDPGHTHYGGGESGYRPSVNPLAMYPRQGIMGMSLWQSNIKMYDDPRGVAFPVIPLSYNSERGLIPTKAIDRYANEMDVALNFAQDGYSKYNYCPGGFKGYDPAPPGYKEYPQADTMRSMSDLQKEIDDDINMLTLHKQRRSLTI